MPYIFLEAWYPTDIVPEVANKYLEILKEMPFDRSLGKELIQAAVSSSRKGIKVVSVTEVKEGKLQEALTWTGTRMIPFQSIKGFEYKTRVWSTIIEALEPLGMSLPG